MGRWYYVRRAASVAITAVVAAAAITAAAGSALTAATATTAIVAVAAPVALYINTPKAKSFLATHNSVTIWQLALPAA